jgi:hypothetical protein
MVLTLPPRLETALAEQARQRSVTPEALAVDVLIRHFLPFTPADEWERRLFEAAVDCVVALSNEALSRESLYD